MTFSCVFLFLNGFRPRHPPTFSLYGFRRWFFFGFRRRRKRFSLWFPSFSFLKYIFIIMVSVVAGKRFFFLLMVSVALILVDSAAARGSNIL